MIFPKNEAVYQNLNTSFTNFAELLVDLKENRFTGCIQVSFWEYEGLLLMDNGNVVNAFEEIGEAQITGPEAAKRVTKKAQEKDGTISVFSLSGDMVTMLASIVKSEVIFEDLSTEFTSLEALISKLQKENHTGYIEVSINGDQRKGIIFLLTGEVIESMITAQGEEISGTSILPRIIDYASSRGATFSVYRSAVEEALEESEEVMVSFDLPQLLEAWGEIIAAAEAVVEKHSKPGHFLNTFKETLISKADQYPFLDPFAAKFQYQGGTITFTGEARKSFSRGLAEGLTSTLEILDDQLEGVDLMEEVHQNTASVYEKHQTLIDRFNLAGMMPEILS